MAATTEGHATTPLELVESSLKTLGSGERSLWSQKDIDQVLDNLLELWVMLQPVEAATPA